MEMPSHPDIIFVRSNQSDDKVQDKSFNVLLFVPHMRNSNENGGSSCHSNENLGQLIQYVLDSNAAPIIKLQCNAPTSLCEIRVNKVQGIIFLIAYFIIHFSLSSCFLCIRIKT